MASLGSMLIMVVALLLTLSADLARAATYSNMATAFNWVDPTAHTRVAWTSGASCSSGYASAPVDDDITVQIPMGFTFKFGGVNYTQVQIMSNGRLQFNNGYCGYGTQTVGPPPTYPYPYSDASVVRTMRVYGVDLDATPSGTTGACPAVTCYVSYATIGSAPNRRFVVTWVNVPEWGANSRTGYFNLQVILEETSNEFVYQFGPSSHPTGGSAQIGWELTTADYAVWSTPVVPPANSAVRFFIPSPFVAPAGFNAFETATPSSSVTGVIKTKVSSSPFAFDVVALKTGPAVETAFTGDVKLELVNASAGSCASYPLIQNLGTLTFAAGDQGRKTKSGVNEANAWPNVRVRISYPATGTPTVAACSSDAFAIRPASFGAVAVSDNDSTSAGTLRTLYNTAATGGNVHKAGRPFRIVATAFNNANAATTNYSGSPAASLSACVLPGTGCTLGSLSTGSWSASAGVVVTATAIYSEAGAFTMKLVDANFATVDAADGSTAAERNIESAPFNVGRFVPDHFDLAVASTPQLITFNDATCATRSFTYAGQPFGYVTPPSATIMAKNAQAGTTSNYQGSLWKLAVGDVTQTYTAVTGVLDTGLVGAPVVTPTGSGTGTLSANAADQIAFVRTTPVAPFAAAISLTQTLKDNGENGVAGNGTIDTATPALFSNIAFDSSNEIRFGRLRLSNAHGSELLDLPVPIETQFWNGSAFARNTADFCTRLNAINVQMSNWQRSLNACETSATLSGRFNAGRGNLRLYKPGAGNSGSVDLTLRLGATGSGSGCVGGVAGATSGASQPWLQGAWTGGAYNQDPAARGSFGLYRGNPALIYLREAY